MAQQKMDFMLGVISVLGCSGSKILHHGSKVFWRIGCAADLLIIHHPQFEVLEVVAFDVRNEIEAPHIFLDMKMLDTKLKAKRGLTGDELKDARVDYVMRRVNAANDQIFMIRLTAMNADLIKEDGTLDIIRSRPRALVNRDYHKIVKERDNWDSRKKWKRIKHRRRIAPIDVETIFEDREVQEDCNLPCKVFTVQSIPKQHYIGDFAVKEDIIDTRKVEKKPLSLWGLVPYSSKDSSRKATDALSGDGDDDDWICSDGAADAAAATAVKAHDTAVAKSNLEEWMNSIRAPVLQILTLKRQWEAAKRNKKRASRMASKRATNKSSATIETATATPCASPTQSPDGKHKSFSERPTLSQAKVDGARIHGKLMSIDV